MQVKRFTTYKSLSEAAANRMVEVVQTIANPLFCLATGDTPRLTYQLFVQQVIERKISLAHCHFIGLDEWVGIPAEDPGSCRGFLYQHVFTPLNVCEDQIRLFNGNATELEAECTAMNNSIASHGGINFMLVGLGMNGHIGFNEPGVDPNLQAHVVELHQTTTAVGQKYFNSPARLRKGITLGLQQVMAAEELVMLVNGAHKAPVVNRLMNEAVHNDLPATFLKIHSNAFLYVDEAALA